MPEALGGDFEGIIDGGGVEKQRSHEGFFLGRFQQDIKVIAAGPGVMFELGEAAAQQGAGDVGGVDPL